MRKAMALGLVMGFFGWAGFCASAMAHEGMESGKDVTVKGEIVDSFCYLGMGAKGTGHKQCGMDCAKAGTPVSIVEEGTGKIYVLMSDKDKTPLPDSVISKMGETITVSGDLYSSGGSQFIAVEAVSK